MWLGGDGRHNFKCFVVLRFMICEHTLQVSSGRSGIGARVDVWLVIVVVPVGALGSVRRVRLGNGCGAVYR